MSSAKTTTDLTKGNPIKLIFFFAIPYLIGNLFQEFYNMADTVIVGRILGTNALAAVGATGSLIWFSTGTIQGLTTGFSAITAQRFGANDTGGIKKSFGMSIVLSVFCAAFMTAVCVIFAMPVLELLNTPDEIIKDSYSYIIWIFMGLFATTLFNLLSNMIRALGDSKTPLIFLVIACAINIILDIVFIAVFGMGTEGAGIATVVAQLLSGIMCVIYIKKRQPELHISLRDLKPEGPLSIQLLKTGIPMASLSMVVSIGRIIIQFVNNSLGTLYVASYAAAGRIDMFVHQPILAFGAAIAVYAAQNYGAGKLKRIKKGVTQCEMMTLAFSTVTAIIMVLFGKYLLYLIVGGESEEIITNGYYFIVINSLLSCILVPLVIYKCVLQSIGRATVPMISGFIEIFCRAATSVILCKYVGFTGICLANPAAWLGAYIPIAINYHVMLNRFKKQGMNEQSDD